MKRTFSSFRNIDKTRLIPTCTSLRYGNTSDRIRPDPCTETAGVTRAGAGGRASSAESKLGRQRASPHTLRVSLESAPASLLAAYYRWSNTARRSAPAGFLHRIRAVKNAPSPMRDKVPCLWESKANIEGCIMLFFLAAF